MTFTGSEPVGAIAPPDADALTAGPSNAVRGRAPELAHQQFPQQSPKRLPPNRLTHHQVPHNRDDVPPGLVEALLREPDVESDRLGRARAWLLQHRHDVDDDVPTCDELAGCILQEAVELASL